MKVSYRLVVLIGIFITCLLTANIMSVKMISFGPVTVFAGIIIFPLGYICGDILTEVYGYRTARKVIWLGFACNAIMVLFFWLGQLLPGSSFWGGQEAYESILGSTPRLLFASFCGYLVGEFSNSVIMAKMKVLTQGRWLWMRTIGSTVVGEGLDTVVFATLATLGTPFFAPAVILYQWLGKTAIETLATPVTYSVVNFFKKKEALDTYDKQTNFNPFAISD